METNLHFSPHIESADAFVAELLASRRPGYSLPQPFYTDARVFALDLDRVFRRQWIFVGSGREISEPGDYFTIEIGPDSLIIARDGDGAVQALYNTCRHRGSRICHETRGKAKHLVCPYHRWVYAHDGGLIHARFLDDDRDRNELALEKAHVEVLQDYIFVCLDEAPPDFEAARRAIEPQLAPHQPARTKICYSREYDVAANWKVIMENNRECYHCRTGHPEFMEANYDLGMNQDRRQNAEFAARRDHMRQTWRGLGLPTDAVSFPNGSWYRCERIPLKEGFVSETISGQPAAPLLGQISDPDCGSLRTIGLPNFWAHANCDYLMTTCLMPVDALRSRVRVNFLVHEDAEEGRDYDVSDVIAIWKATSEQDWTLCENNQLGIHSSAYKPGPYLSLVEQSVEDFVVWYLNLLAKPRG